ncbi:adenosine deaminase 2-like [Leptidea sinapis]|uniref:adenosine deaminase 2-like n=1 Tax=Leptidea sinapis TaxID=189913 RepID=UPI00214677A2|nr:adenosine deaminase 2-like [Leptidea sinapis]
MPKGAALHIHSTLMLSTDKLMALTYEKHLYACLADGELDLQFSRLPPQRPCSFKWILLSELRERSNNVTRFDSELRKYFTMVTNDERFYDKDINYTWKKFNKVCKTIQSLISYRPVREKFFLEALNEFYSDNIMYIEIRSGLSRLYELDGRVHNQTYWPYLMQRVANQFKKEHPDFIGIKLILTRSRLRSVNETLEAAREIKEYLPDIFAGFDLVGQEDIGKPLSDYVPTLLEAKKNMKFFFHGGETNWFGTSTDENLVDAILLGAKRIGHGYALIKHPDLMDAVKKKDIAVEVNVISNTVLSLVRDVRNHPLATYLATDMPIVISSDDPGMWDSDPLSHDFYVMFVGVASKKADLRTLKQLVINSIRYSELDNRGKRSMFKIFNKKWHCFIRSLITLHKS